MGTTDVWRKYDPEEIDNREHDETLKTKKVILYGWDGSNAVALKVTADGEVILA